MFLIEKGVALPPKLPRSTAGQTKYPWAEMSPADSVFFDIRPNTVRVQLHRWRLKHPEQRFVTRNELSGIRVWRTE